MRTITRIINFFGVSMILFIGCNKPETPQSKEETEENGSVLTTDFYIKAKVDGEEVIVKGDRCTYTIGKEGGMQIESYRPGLGNDATHKTFTFSIGLATLGNHKFSDETGGGTGLYTVNGSMFFTKDDGNVEITKLDTSKKIVEGRFAMNVKKVDTREVKKITEGTFRCKGK